MDRGRAYNLMHFLSFYIKLLGYVQSVLILYLKGGLGVLAQKNFTELGTKLGNSRHF